MTVLICFFCRTLSSGDIWWVYFAFHLYQYSVFTVISHVLAWWFECFNLVVKEENDIFGRF